jgi:hypothetical protein
MPALRSSAASGNKSSDFEKAEIAKLAKIQSGAFSGIWLNGQSAIADNVPHSISSKELNMANDWYLIQIRIGSRTRVKIKELAAKYDSSQADIARGSLELGIKVMEVLMEAQDIITQEYLRLLKGQSRNRPSKSIKIKTTADNDSIEDEVGEINDL